MTGIKRGCFPVLSNRSIVFLLVRADEPTALIVPCVERILFSDRSPDTAAESSPNVTESPIAAGKVTIPRSVSYHFHG